MTPSVLIGSLILTYFVSRITNAIASRWVYSPWNLILAHGFSLGILWLALGVLKNNPYQTIIYEAGWPLVVPQMIWLIFDLVRRPARAV
jgi:hypothetical protein